MKKKKNIELDVDFIGEQKHLTKEEERKISEYIRQNRRKKIKLKKSRKITV